ncbi:hypothetical protein S245_031113 [Arachis hypogaea]
MSSSSLGAYPPSDSSCSRSSCRRRLGVIVSKITRKKINYLEHLHTNMSSPSSSFPMDPSLDLSPVLRTLVVIMLDFDRNIKILAIFTNTGAEQYDLIKCINAGPTHKAPIEMVVLDEEGDTIQCTVKDIFVLIFEGLLAEGNVYVVTNFGVALNTIKFKLTRHEFRIHFKRDTIVRLVQDSSVPLNGFNFVPFKTIQSESKEDDYLVDVIGQLASKDNLVKFTRDGKPSSYITIELDNLEGGHKLKVTLWQSFAFELLKYLEEHPCLTYVVILQMGKMKFYSGVMGVSNTNYNSKLFINVEFPAAKDFFTRVNKLDPVDGQGIMPLVCDQPVSDEEDFLRLSVYKTIAEIKEHNQDAVFVTAGTIKEVETEFGWWYKGCKKCRRDLRELEKRYFCPNCIRDYEFFEPRYIIHIRVIDHTDAASFVLFDGEAAKFLRVSANDLRQSCVTKGVEKNSCPEEINKFRDIKFIFKVQLKMRNLNYYEPYVIHVLRMTNENSLISAFLDKYNPDTGLLSHENSELLSLSTGPYDTSKACESEPTPSPAVDEKHNSKILGAKKHMKRLERSGLWWRTKSTCLYTVRFKI